jgi:hypothetical protein
MVDSGNSKSIAQLLLEAARQDEAACILLATGTGIGDALVGFHAQQAVGLDRNRAVTVVGQVIAWAIAQIEGVRVS